LRRVVRDQNESSYDEEKDETDEQISK